MSLPGGADASSIPRWRMLLRGTRTGGYSESGAAHPRQTVETAGPWISNHSTSTALSLSHSAPNWPLGCGQKSQLLEAVSSPRPPAPPAQSLAVVPQASCTHRHRPPGLHWTDHGSGFPCLLREWPEAGPGRPCLLHGPSPPPTTRLLPAWDCMCSSRLL